MSAGGPGGHIYWVVGNTFKNVQDITTIKQGAFMNFVNNTVIDALIHTISFNPPDDPVDGLGGVFDSNIFVNAPSPFDTVTPTGTFIVTRNVLPADQVGLGAGNTNADPRLKDLVKPDVTLLPGSSAIGTGANGIDRGAKVSLGASISGEPPVNTSSASATLTVGGPAIMSYKYRVNGGAWSAETPISTPISLSGLTNGAYTVDVAGRNFAGVWQADAAATHSKTWAVNTALSKVIINEVLANNVNGVSLSATKPDVIELYNAGATTANLADMSITDGLGSPRKYVFPVGTSIPVGGYLTLYADSLPSQSGELHT